MGTECCDINPEDDDFDLPEDTQKRSVKQFSLVNLNLNKDEKCKSLKELLKIRKNV